MTTVQLTVNGEALRLDIDVRRSLLDLSAVNRAVGAIRQPLNCVTRALHYCEATFVRNGELACVNRDVSQHRQTPSVDRRPGVYENVAALFCVPLHCTAFDCDGEDAQTP